MTARLPIPGGDDGRWGEILNKFLEVSLNHDGTLKKTALSHVGGESTTRKNKAYGYAGLDKNAKIPLALLPATTLSSVGDFNIASPTSGQTLIYDGTSNRWRNQPFPFPSAATATRLGLIQLDGDLGGTATSPTVPGLASKYVKPAGGIPSTDLSSAVQTNLTDASTAVQVGGDLGGTNTAPTIAKLQGTTLNGGSPTSGQVLSYNGSEWVPATVSSSTIGDATSSSKGIVQLDGDLGGTAGSPTVPSASGLRTATTSVDVSGATAPTAGQVLTATSGTAADWTTPAAGVTLDSTTSDIQADTTTGSAIAGSTGKAADAGHQHPLVTHDHSTTNKGGQITPTTGLSTTGTPSSTTYLRGDNTWTTPPTASNATSSSPGLIQLDGDLGGSATSPTVASLDGVALPVSAPSSAGQVLTATSSSATAWQTPAAGVTLDNTAGDIQPLGSQSAGNTGKAADAGHVHPTTGLLLSSNDLSELTGSASTARANLGLGSAATQNTSAFDAAGTASSAVATETSRAEAAEALALQKSNNLSDVSDAGTSRANIHVPALTPAACVVTTNVSSLSGLNTYDGHTLTAGDLVLLTGQTTASQNGLWTAASGSWTRPTEMGTGVSMKARTVAIIQGTTYAGTIWLLQTNSSITVDTTSQSWVQQLSNSAQTTIRTNMFRYSRKVAEMASALPPATPPTIAAGTSSSSISSGTFVPATDSRFRSSNVATYAQGSAGPGSTAGYVPRAQYTNGTVTYGPQPIRWHFRYDGNQFEFVATDNGALLTIWVDGQPHTAVPQSFGGGSGNCYYFLVNLGTRGPHEIILEGENIFRFYGITTQPTAVMTASDTPLGRVFDVGDSITQGDYATINGTLVLQKSHSVRCGRLLGIDDWWMGPSAGGTGFLQTSGGGNPPYSGRINYDVMPYMTGNDAIILRGSTNDNSYTASQITAAVLATIQQIMGWTITPRIIIVTGLTPCPPDSGTLDATNTAAVQAGATAAAAQYPGVVYYVPLTGTFTGTGNTASPTGNGNADFYAISGDAPHPNLLGHEHLAATEAPQFAPILGVPYSPPRRPEFDLMMPSVGEEAIARDKINSTAITIVNSQMRLTYFRATRTENINHILAACGGTAAGATPSYVLLGIYQVNPNGSLTLLATTANNTALFGTANALLPSQALTSTFTKIAGAIYAVACLVVTAATQPSTIGLSSAGDVLFGENEAPTIAAISTLSSPTALPPTVSLGALTATGAGMWSALLP